MNKTRTISATRGLKVRATAGLYTDPETALEASYDAGIVLGTGKGTATQRLDAIACHGCSDSQEKVAVG